MFGRRRRLPDAMNEDEYLRERALRQGVNFPIQSTLHDMMLWCQWNVRLRMLEANLKSVMVGEIHDSMVIDYYKPELSIVAKIIKDVCENMPWSWINVPMVVDIEYGPNLTDVKPYVLAA